MKVLTDTEQDYLQRMINVELNLDSWKYFEYGCGCSFGITIDDLYHNLWYSGSIVQIDITTEDRKSRLGIRLNDVAGFDKKIKLFFIKIKYMHLVDVPLSEKMKCLKKHLT